MDRILLVIGISMELIEIPKLFVNFDLELELDQLLYQNNLELLVIFNFRKTNFIMPCMLMLENLDPK